MDDMALYVLGYHAGKKKGGSGGIDPLISRIKGARTVHTMPIGGGYSLVIKEMLQFYPDRLVSFYNSMPYVQTEVKSLELYSCLYNGAKFICANPTPTGSTETLVSIYRTDWFNDDVDGTHYNFINHTIRLKSDIVYTEIEDEPNRGHARITRVDFTRIETYFSPFDVISRREISNYMGLGDVQVPLTDYFGSSYMNGKILTELPEDDIMRAQIELRTAIENLNQGG